MEKDHNETEMARVSAEKIAISRMQNAAKEKKRKFIKSTMCTEFVCALRFSPLTTISLAKAVCSCTQRNNFYCDFILFSSSPQLRLLECQSHEFQAFNFVVG